MEELLMSRNGYSKTNTKRNMKSSDKFEDTKSKGSNKSKNTRRNKSFDFKKDGAGLDNSGRDNDPNYYFVSPELAQQAGQLSFQNVLGGGPVVGQYRVPGIMAISFNPCMGGYYDRPHAAGAYFTRPGFYKSKDAALNAAISGSNLMLTKIYTALSTYSGRTASYLPSDIGIMIGAISSFSEVSEHIRRAIGVATVYNARNRMMPRRLLEAMGVHPDDLFANISDYRMRFNTIIARMNQIPLLDNISFIRKSREMYQKVYVDSDSPMAQYIVFVPASAWIIDETAYKSGTCLKTVDLIDYANPLTPLGGDVHGQVLSMKTWLDKLASMAEALLTSSTLQIVYADLMHFAAKVNVPMWHFDYLAENYVVMPEYNANFLLQLHNLDIVGCPRTLTVSENDGLAEAIFDIDGTDYHYLDTNRNDVVSVPDTGYLMWNPVFTYGGNMFGPSIVDFPMANPDVADIIESMRFSAATSGYGLRITEGTLTKDVAVELAIADHYAVAMRIYDEESSEQYVNTTSKPTAGKNASDLTKFNSAPLFYIRSTDSDSVFGDLNYYTTVDYAYLERINKLMFEGLFDFRLGSNK